MFFYLLSYLFTYLYKKREDAPLYYPPVLVEGSSTKEAAASEEEIVIERKPARDRHFVDDSEFLGSTDDFFGEEGEEGAEEAWAEDDAKGNGPTHS
jgi:hypothetical protein